MVMRFTNAETLNGGEKPAKLLSLEEAASQLNYSPSGLRKIVNRTKRGKPGPQIQFFQAGHGPIKFRQEWIDEFVLSNSLEPGQVVTLKNPKHGRRVKNGSRTPIEPIWTTAV
jgi:hypothetical protein